jgi:hypothetical protein
MNRLRRGSAASLLLLLVVAGVGTGACSGSGTSASAPPAPNAPAPKALAATTTTSPPLPEVAVRTAYLRSWDDYARAVWNLDPRGLDRTYARDALGVVQDEVDQRIRERRRSRVEVAHDLQVIVINADHAAVTDNVVNSSVAVNADTGADLEVRHPEPVLFQMMLEKIDGAWKVVFLT